MSWHVKNPADRADPAPATAEKAALFEELKQSSVPTIEKDQGQKPVDPVSFQPVISPGIFEAEFTSKDGDVIFHFWPHGYHSAERLEVRRLPSFPANFMAVAKQVFAEIFGQGRVVLTEDSDVGAITIRALTWGDAPYARELAIKACTKLHSALGGVEG